MCSTFLNKEDFALCLKEALSCDMIHDINILLSNRSLLKRYLCLYCCPKNSAKLFSCWDTIFFEYASIYDKIITKKLKDGDFAARMAMGKKMKNMYQRGRHIQKPVWCSSFATLLMKFGQFEECEARLLFYLNEKYLEQRFWRCWQRKKNRDVSSFLKEPNEQDGCDTDDAAKSKLYDIIGYCCGHRVSKVVKSSRLKKEIGDVYELFVQHNFYKFHAEAKDDNLPADYLYNRENKNGLHFCRVQLLSLMSYMNHIVISILTTDFLILFSTTICIHTEVTALILKSTKIALLYRACIHKFITADSPLYEASMQPFDQPSNALSLLLHFITLGYMRVMLKDRYRVRLNNALGCNKGGSIRTELQVSSKPENKKRKASTSSSGNGKRKAVASLSGETTAVTILSCPRCQKTYQRKKPYEKHVSTCEVIVDQIIATGGNAMDDEELQQEYERLAGDNGDDEIEQEYERLTGDNGDDERLHTETDDIDTDYDDDEMLDSKEFDEECRLLRMGSAFVDEED